MKDTNKSTNVNHSLQERKKQAKQILTDREPNLSIESAFEFVDEDELRYFFDTMKDIITYLIDNESAKDLAWTNSLHGAIRLENLVKGEIMRRMERQGFDIEFADNLK